jgi:hypothetical protein
MVLGVNTSTPMIVQIGLCAPRVAVVFNGGDGWHDWARLGIHTATHFWGGRGFLLVPHVDGVVDPVMLRAARTYDPDYVVLLNSTIAQMELIAPDSIPLRIEGRELQGDERARMLEQVGDSPVDDPAGRRAREAVAAVCSPHVQRRDNGDGERLVSLGKSDQLSPLTPMSTIDSAAVSRHLSAPPAWGGAVGVLVAARCGLLREPATDAAPQVSAADRETLLRWLLVRGGRFVAPPPEHLLETVPTSATAEEFAQELRTVFDRTTTGLSQAGFGYQERGRAVLVIGDSAADFAAAYARDLLYGDGVWLPTELSPVGADDDAEQMRFLLQTTTLMAGAHRENGVIVSTVTASTEAVNAAVAALCSPEIELGGSAGVEYQQQFTTTVVAGQLDFPTNGALSWVLNNDLDHPAAIPATADEDGTITMLSPTPVPDVSDVTLREAPDLTWQVEVRPETPITPTGRGLSGDHLFAPGSNLYLTWVRSGRNGTRFESHRYDFLAAGTPRLSRLARPKLSQPSLMQWASCLAGQHGKTVQWSDAGRRAEVLRRLVGGRQPLAELFAGPMLPVLRGFLSDTGRSKDRYPDGGGVVLHAAGTNDAGWEGYLTFEGMQRFTDRADEAALVADVDDLTTTGILTRGIIVNCATCGRVSFITIDEAGRSNTCARCKASNPLTQPRWRHPSTGPQWFFDLHPVARDLLRSNGEVPLQLAHYLRGMARSYTDASEFELCEAGKPRAELDLPAYADEQVVVGEAKSSTTLGSHPAKEATKKVLLADILQADQLLFATTQPHWEAASVNAIRTSVSSHDWARGEAPAVRIISSLGSKTCRDQRLNLQDGAVTTW